jgi:hypothetical protein
MPNDTKRNLKISGYSIFLVAILLTIFEIGFFYKILVPITEKEKNKAISEIGANIAKYFTSLKKNKMRNVINTLDLQGVEKLLLMNIIDLIDLNKVNEQIDNFKLPNKLSLIETLDYREKKLTSKINLYVFMSSIMIIILLFIFLNKLIKSIKEDEEFEKYKEDFTGSQFSSFITILIICTFQYSFFKLSKKYLYTIYGLKSFKIKDIEDFIYITGMGTINDKNITIAKDKIFKKYLNDDNKVNKDKLPQNLKDILNRYDKNNNIATDNEYIKYYCLEIKNGNYKRKYNIGSYISRNINEACIDYEINKLERLDENNKKRIRYNIYDKILIFKKEEIKKEEIKKEIKKDLEDQLKDAQQKETDIVKKIIEYIDNVISKEDLKYKICNSEEFKDSKESKFLINFIKSPYENRNNLTLIKNKYNKDLLLNPQNTNQDMDNSFIDTNYKEIIYALINDKYYKFDESYKFGNGDNETEMLLLDENHCK